MPITELTWVYNGLTMGIGTDYQLNKVEGISRPDGRISETEKMGDDGSFIFGEFLQPRVIVMEGDIAVDSGMETKLNSMRQAFAPQGSTLPLQLRLAGDITKRINCIPTRGPAFAIDQLYSIGYAVFILELRAEDPRIYDDVESSQAISSGLSQVLNNAGVYKTFPKITINGPGVTNPTIKNVTANQTLKVNTTLGAGDALVIDFLLRTVKKNGASIYGSLDATSVWWALAAGNSTVQYVSGGGSLTVNWRSAWI